MIGHKRFIAVIPARGGSVGVPRKNIKPLAGRPLLDYTLDHALAVAALDLVVVSTDDDAIAEVARARGVRVVKRPAELATSEARTESAVLHALDSCADAGRFDYVVLLEPTSPLREPASVARAMAEIVQSGSPSLVSVVEERGSLGRVVEGRFAPLFPDAPRRRQDRQPLYSECGVAYICSIDELRRTGCLLVAPAAALIVSETEATDINTPADFAFAEVLMLARNPSP